VSQPAAPSAPALPAAPGVAGPTATDSGVPAPIQFLLGSQP
jgi:hypothetical protein